MLKWKPMNSSPLETWIHKSGKVVLSGDSCPSMPSCRAQGAVMAVEDAGVVDSLSTTLSSSSTWRSFYTYMRTHETKDADMHPAMEAEMSGDVLEAEGSQNEWADRKACRVQFGHDAKWMWRDDD
ncbi:hypothetical protein DACRYDRAFT_106774 [Dacryopinax primogenitus]|uniref:Uncharacterized protein n=1 Tax=Dacryopinax primogenitus (strain DJM 731) TaxID=1858805 RepID=M5FXI0_DACPD|nr:uncharacterized protein DACRYDRAFT_106774 [Dacryopinax primogenitus]EJU02711.1 hypothetical protein DACRYDRAFT_106774 [Dacryopinax primogenitus]